MIPILTVHRQPHWVHTPLRNYFETKSFPSSLLPCSGHQRRRGALTGVASAGDMPKLETKRKLKPAQPTKKFALKKAENRRFRTRHGLAYSGKNTPRQRLGTYLRDIQQPAYAEIVSKSQSAAKKFLQQHGAILAKETGSVFHCWECSSAVTAKTAWRCQNKACAVRARFTNPTLSYSPLFHSAAAGHEVDFATFLRACYLIGCKISNDSAAHLARQPEQTLRSCQHKINDLYPRLKLILSWQNAIDNETIHFDNEFVEVDSGRFGVKKGKGFAKNLGRTMVLIGRFARKNWMARGLPNRSGSSGRTGPETKAEVTPTIQQKLGRATVLCGDGAKAWQHAAASSSRPMLQGVKHGQRLFTPVSTLQKKDLDTPTKNFLKRCSQDKIAAAKTYRKKVVAAGGDNIAEGLVSHLKGTARRLGSLKGGRTVSTRSKSVAAQSSASLLREPGLYRVLAACKNFREACMKGDIKVSPRNAFDFEAHPWLTAEDREDAKI